MARHASTSIPWLLAIYAALPGLLALTITAARFPLGALGLLIALGIAAIKTLLVAMFLCTSSLSRAMWQSLR